MGFKIGNCSKKWAVSLGLISLVIVFFYPYFFNVEFKSFTELFFGDLKISSARGGSKYSFPFLVLVFMFTREFWVIVFETSFLFILFKTLLLGCR